MATVGTVTFQVVPLPVTVVIAPTVTLEKEALKFPAATPVTLSL